MHNLVLKRPGFLSNAVAAGGIAIILGLITHTDAAVYQVSNNLASGTGSLSQALASAQSDTAAVINISPAVGNITLSGSLPQIQNNLVLNGNGCTINGAGAQRIFFVNAPGGTVQINALTLTNGWAVGGTGGGGYGGGGGGGGLGGAIFVNSGSLTVSNITFAANSARGGTGGLGFDGGVNATAGGGGGGGGMGFAGGQATGGSDPTDETYEGPGAGGGALTSAGAMSSANAPRAGQGGGINGGLGGSLGLGVAGGNGVSPSLPDGGGGGGGLATSTSTPVSGGNGGNGSDFSGGGGAGSSNNGDSGLSGNGGFAGGGGGGALTLVGGAYPGGIGGFGGGGGGGGEGAPGNAFGGAGGFGGGSGANGATGNAGGGLGAGGAIFVRTGSRLTVQDSAFSGDTVIAGQPGNGPATAGFAIGQALFLGDTVTYSVSSGTNTLSETIGGGSDANAGGSFNKSGAGTLVLVGTESYVGNTTVNGGTLVFSNTVPLSPVILVNDSAILDYHFTSRIGVPAAAYTGAGTLRISGPGQVYFGAGPVAVDFSPGALIDVESGSLIGSASYNGIWTANDASMQIAAGAYFDAVESGPSGTMQMDALTGTGVFQGGYFGNANGGLSVVTIGVAGGSGTFAGTLQNNTTGILGLVKTGAGAETLTGTNTYTGGTTINDGVLVVNGSLGAGSVTVTGGTLAGSGAIGGPVGISSGGSLAPGAPLGALAINNTLNLAGNTLVALSNGVCSQVTGLASVNYGGTLTVSNIGGPLSPGQTFSLFAPTPSSGNFANIVGNAGNALAYSFNPANGVLTIIPTLPITPTNLTYSVQSNSIHLNWPPGYTGWILQSQTNPASVGLSTNWVDVPGSAATDAVTFPIGPASAVFFRLRY
jgi:autotransporter-associated beta strand protein